MTTVGHELIATAEKLLSVKAGDTVKLGEIELLESPNIVARLAVEKGQRAVGRSVIVKSVTDTTFNVSDKPSSDRFLNEWAALRFLSSDGYAKAVAPRLLGASRESSILVIEDVGHHRTLESALLESTYLGIDDAFASCGRLLGHLHGQSRGREMSYRQLQQELGAHSPQSDSTRDLRGRLDVFEESFSSLGIRPQPGFETALASVEEKIHALGPFRTLIHADAGPQNFLLAEPDPVMIDFEFAVYRHALSDALGPRLGFPQTFNTMRVPNEAADVFEREYRATLVQMVPEASDDGLYESNYDAAAHHWALNRWVGLWEAKLRTVVHDTERRGEGDATHIARIFVLWESYLDRMPQSALSATIGACLGSLRQIWPETRADGIYPAFGE